METAPKRSMKSQKWIHSSWPISNASSISKNNSKNIQTTSLCSKKPRPMAFPIAISRASGIRPQKRSTIYVNKTTLFLSIKWSIRAQVNSRAPRHISIRRTKKKTNRSHRIRRRSSFLARDRSGLDKVLNSIMRPCTV